MRQTETPARIVKNARICGGEPTLEGTRIPVRCIVVEYQNCGDLERVLAAYPQLNLRAIQAALSYYESHREEIDRLIGENEQAAYAAE